MHKYVITGRVIPERGDVNFNGKPATVIKVEMGGGFYFLLDLQIIKSQITAFVFESNRPFSRDELSNIVESLVRVRVDAIGFFMGCGFDIEMLSFMSLEDGERWTLGVSHDAVSKKNFSKSLSIEKISKIAFGNHSLRRALADLRECIRSSEDTAFFAYRAIDSVMQDFRPKHSDSKEQAWMKMRENLNLSKAWIEEMSKLSHATRHGRHEPVDLECRSLLIRRAWLVVDRFAVWLEGGRNPLDKDQFPLYLPIGVFI